MAIPYFRNIVIVGADGTLGSPIVHAHPTAGNFKITVISRPASTGKFPTSVRVLKGDYTPNFLDNAFKDINAVVLTIGSSALEEQKVVIDAAAKAGG